MAVLKMLEEYSGYDLGNFFQLGRSRPVREGHRLEAKSISYHSPLQLVAIIPHDVLYGAYGGGAVAFLFALKKLIKGVYTIDLDLRNARLRKQIENANLEWELEQVKQQPEVRRLHQRVRNQRLQLEQAEFESGDPPGAP